MVLVPATMALLGQANWWLPAWLDRVLPHLDAEGGAGVPIAVPRPEPIAVPRLEPTAVRLVAPPSPYAGLTMATSSPYLNEIGQST
jgi:RND superfamily putative drug exporter